MLPTINAALNIMDHMHDHCVRLRNENVELRAALKDLVSETLQRGVNWADCNAVVARAKELLRGDLPIALPAMGVMNCASATDDVIASNLVEDYEVE